MNFLVAFLLAVAVLACLCSALGVLVMGRPLDRLHYTGIATVLGTIPLTLAVVVQAGASTTTVKAVAVAVVILLKGPVLNQASGRAIIIRTRGASDPGWELTR